MSKQVVTVGIDVGAEELWVAVKGRKPRSFKHRPTGIRSLHRWVSRRADGAIVHYCLEATGVYGVHVASQLVSLAGVRVSIVNPAVIAAFGRTRSKRSKTDQIDAELIRSYAEQNQPALWQPETGALRHLALLVAQADAIKNILLQWENRSHSHQFISDLPTEVRQTQRAVHRSLQRQLAKIERAIDNLCATDPELAHLVALLETIPGIGRRSATQLLAYGGSRWQRYSARAMTAQAGLAPRHHRSGSSIDRKQRIDKQGDARLRKALYMPALVGATHNPALKKQYQRLCHHGKLKKVALVACMRKMLVIAHAVIITKKPFNHALHPLT
jgi:transposase